MEFGRRVALERELDKNDVLVHSNAVFDESGNFILYATLAGVKVSPGMAVPLVMSFALHFSVRPC